MSTAEVVPYLHWKNDVAEHDYAAASSYLSIRFGERRAGQVAAQLRTLPVVTRRANDILRATGRDALPLSDPGVLKDLKKVLGGERLSPVLVAEGDIADGYHRGSLAAALAPCAAIPLTVGGLTSPLRPAAAAPLGIPLVSLDAYAHPLADCGARGCAVPVPWSGSRGPGEKLDKRGDREAEGGHHLEADLEGVRVGAAAECVVEDDSDQGHPDRTAGLLSCRQDARGGRGVVRLDAGQDDGGHRRHRQAHPCPGDRQPGDQPAGAVMDSEGEQQVPGRHRERTEGEHLAAEPERDLARLRRGHEVAGAKREEDQPGLQRRQATAILQVQR